MDFRHADNPIPFAEANRLRELRMTLNERRLLAAIKITTESDSVVIMDLISVTNVVTTIRFNKLDITHVSNALIAFQQGHEVDWDLTK